MTAPQVEVTRTTTLHPSRDGRLLPYGVLTFGVLTAALVFGEAGLVPFAVPFALALAWGLRRTAPVEVTSRIVLFSDRVLEGDAVNGRVEISWRGAFNARVRIHGVRGMSITDDDASEWGQATERLEVPVRLKATRWGRHSVGEIWLRLTLPFGLLSWTGKVADGPPVRVLPGTERLRKLLSPSQSRAAWGVHGSTRLGDGHDFAELRPYVPGDRLRDLNWAATARMGHAIVNRHHPEVSSDVVIALDAFDDGSAASVEVLARTARAAWALASVHLQANDRVGLVGLGASTQWLPPASGRLAQFKLMDTLLQVGAATADRVAVTRRWVDVPPSALVVALSTLQDDLSVLSLMTWRAKGRSVAVIVIDPTTALDPPDSTAEALARRLWGLEFQRRIAELRRAGVPVVRAPVDGAMSPILGALRRSRGMSPARRA